MQISAVKVRKWKFFVKKSIKFDTFEELSVEKIHSTDCLALFKD